CECEWHARVVSLVTISYERSAPLQEIAMPLKREVEGSVQEWVARADEGGQRLTLGRDELFLEGDPLVSRKDGIARPNLAITVPHRGRHMRDFVATCLALPR